MARPNKTGVRGLYRETVTVDGKAAQRWSIDLAWREPGTGERRRYKERLPLGVKADAAKEHALRVLNAAIKGGFEPKKLAPKRLREATDEYLRWAAVDRPQTLGSRRSLCGILVAGLGDVVLDELGPFHVERFKKARKDEGAAPATINRAVAQLKHLLGKAVEWGWVSAEKARPIACGLAGGKPLTDEATIPLLRGSVPSITVFLSHAAHTCGHEAGDSGPDHRRFVRRSGGGMLTSLRHR